MVVTEEGNQALTPVVEPARAGWWTAETLEVTAMTAALETRIRVRMGELGGEAAEQASSVQVRVVSCVPASLRVPGVLRRHFVTMDGGALPEVVPFESRAVVLFQKTDGVDLCVFSMYVHEFGAGRAYGPSARRVYIAYLDSVEYLRPRTSRTAVYHELLAGYLDWARQRGFEAAHIWACPPQKGNNFIFWCHPSHQRTPSRERLTDWYRTMVRRAVAVGAISRVANLYDEYYAPFDATRRRAKHHSGTQRAVWVQTPRDARADHENDLAAGAPRVVAGNAASSMTDQIIVTAAVCPPLFDGDYWPEEACRLHALIERRKGLFGAHSLRSQGEASVADQLDTLLKHVVAQPASYPFMRPVDPVALGLADYAAIVPEPMDLGTVAARLQRSAYGVPQDFVDDVRLTFRNAMAYNPPAHPVHEAAAHLSLLFEKKLQATLQRLKQNGVLSDARDFLKSYTLNTVDVDVDADAAPVPSDPAHDTSAAPLMSDANNPQALVGAGPGERSNIPSMRARLLPELAASVHKMKDSLFVLYLQPDQARNADDRGARAAKAKRSDRRQTPPIIADPDAGKVISCPLLDSRHTFLEMCQFWHYQFDTLRRAKHSSIMLLYHLHNSDSDSLGIPCSNCAREIRRVRWHCATCIDYNICRECERTTATSQGPERHTHVLTPFRITFSRPPRRTG
jgi:hypothetical protein